MTALDNKTRAGTRDGYGFVVPTPYVSLFRENSRVYEVEEAHRTKSWGTWTAAYGGCLTTALEAARMARMESNRAGAGDASTSGSSRVPYHELGVLVKTVGVPKEMRRQVWLSCLVDKGMFGEGGAGDWSRSMSEYVCLVGKMEGAAFADDLQQIEKDLHRTFPNHALTNSVWGKASLRRVLGAYAVRNPLVGYCQGLNFLAAMFLLVFIDTRVGEEAEIWETGEAGVEEDQGENELSAWNGSLLGKGRAAEAAAFWCFTALVEQILTGYFDPMMINQQVDGLVFEQLVREVLPEIAVHFDDVGVHVPTAVAGWFLVAFVNTLATESAMRVWDVLFFEKSPAVMFRAGLGLLFLYEEAILECPNDSDSYMLLQALGPITFNASWLVEAMEDFSHIKGSVVQVLRDKYAPGVTKVMNRMFPTCPDASGGGTGSGGVGGSSAGSSMGPSNATSTSSGGYRGLTDDQRFTTKYSVSADIEKRLGILRLRHKEPTGPDQGTIQDSSGTQDSLRRTQSALVDSSPGIVLQGRNERLKQQLRINLLAMRTFVPDMKLLTTALRIASGNSRDEGKDTADGNDTDAGNGHGGGCRVGRGERPAMDTVTEEIGHMDEKAVVPNPQENTEHRTPGAASRTKPVPVTRRFTDGGALLASPFREGTQGAVHSMAGTQKVGTMDPAANSASVSVQSTSMQALPLEKLRNIDAMKSALTAEVSRSVELLEETSASNLQLEAEVAQVGDQLCKLQDEIGHKVSTYDALFQRARELQEETNMVEVTYRKQLAANLQLADSWREISKEIKKNDATLKKLMDLAETRAAGNLMAAEPPSPTKKFKQRAQAMVNRKFTR